MEGGGVEEEREGARGEMNIKYTWLYSNLHK